jgi:cell wall-associated NlpC family hydrolase
LNSRGPDLDDDQSMTTRVQRYGPGDEASDLQPGDFILAQRHRPISTLISVAERRRFRGRDSAYAHWSHCALVVDRTGQLVEAEARGVVAGHISKYRDDEYHVVMLGPGFVPGDRDKAVAYALSQVGAAFGYLAALGAVLFLLLGLPFRMMRRNHQICSGLVTRALQMGGLLPEFDASRMLPADLAKAFDVRP